MRKKEEILKDTRRDIVTEEHKENAPLWVQYRLIEVLIDIRDELHDFKDSFQAIPFWHNDPTDQPRKP